MADTHLHCPSCFRSLVVPSEMLGRLVKCPNCSTTFNIAPAVDPSGTAGPQIGSIVPVGWDEGQVLEAQAKHAVRPAGLCLLLTSMMGLAMCMGLLSFFLLIDPEGTAFRQKVEEMYPERMQMIDEEAFQWSLKVLRFSFIGSALANAIIFFGAIQMMRLRMYWLAFAGCILALLSFYPVPWCAVFGLPTGAWSLVVLCRSETRAAFQ